jgi:hypothetical protein
MVDQEPQAIFEAKFVALKDQIVSQMAITYKDSLEEYAGVVVPIVFNEDYGQSLMLGSDGKWSGRVDMMGYEVAGDLNRLIEEYASITDPTFRAIELSFWNKPDNTEIEEIDSSEEVGIDIRDKLSQLGSQPTLGDFLAAGFTIVKPEDLKLRDFSKPTEEEIAEMNAREAENEAEKQAYLLPNRTRLLEGLINHMETVLNEIKQPQKPTSD